MIEKAREKVGDDRVSYFCRDLAGLLEERVAHLEDPQGFVEASTLAPLRQMLPDELFQPFSERMMEVMGQPHSFNYVRLNIEARRA